MMTLAAATLGTRIEAAMACLANNQPEAARALLEALQLDVPHHPQVLYLLAQLAPTPEAALGYLLTALSWERRRPEPFALAASLLAGLGYGELAKAFAARAGVAAVAVEPLTATPLPAPLLAGLRQVAHPPRISLCMIVKNEAEGLARCLAAAAPHVDDIVILDTGSHDDTVAIARGFGAHVEPFAWVDDFAAARNASLEAATGDWVLVLDADEVFDAPPRALHALLDTLPDPWLTGVVASVHVLRLNYAAEGQAAADAQEVYLPRLFPRAFTRWEFAIHESPSVLVAPPDAQVLPLVQSRFQVAGIRLHHSGHMPGAVAARNKSGRNLALLYKRVEASATDFAGRLYLADELLSAGDFAKAAEHFAAGWAITPPGRHDELREDVFQNWGMALLKGGQTAEALALVEEAIPHKLGQAGLLALAGAALELLNRPSEALTRFQQAQAAGGRGTWAEMAAEGLTRLTPRPDALGLLQLGQVYQRAGNFEEARRLFEQARGLAPRHPQVHYLLAALALQTHQLEEAWQHITHSLGWERVRAEPFALAGDIASALGEAKLAHWLHARAANQVVEPVLDSKGNPHWLTPPRVSLCVVLSAGPAPHLARCLAHAAPHVDEVLAFVVADTDAAARAVLAARGAIVHELPGVIGRLEATHLALQLATGTWVLMLAPDEWLECAPEMLKRLLATLPEPHVFPAATPVIGFALADGRVEPRCFWRTEGQVAPPDAPVALAPGARLQRD